MKNSINKIVLFAAVFFAAGLSNISANAQQASFGYYIVDNNNTGFYTATGYPTADAAEDAATEVCDNDGWDVSNCDGFTNRGVIGGTETNKVFVWSRSFSGDYSGVGVDFAAAYASFFAACEAPQETDCNNDNYAEGMVLSCGAGSEEDAADDCDVRYEPPTSAADCPGEFFNNAASPARCEPFITCTDSTVELDMTTNQCRCVTAGDVFVSGSNMQMCETPPPDLSAPIPNQCPTSGNFDLGAGTAATKNCGPIDPPTGATNDGENIPGVTVVLAGVYGNERVMVVINNRTEGSGDIDYRNGGFPANAILVPIDADLPNLPLSDILASNGEPTPVGYQNDIAWGTGEISGFHVNGRIALQYYSRPQTVGFAFCTGEQVHATGDTTMCVDPPPTSAADCPGEFFNNAASPARCDPFITTCTDSTVELDMTTNQCSCITAGDDFVPGSNMQMCETPTTATPTCTGTATLEPVNRTVCECLETASPILMDDGGNSFSCRAANDQRDCDTLQNGLFYDPDATAEGNCSATDPNAGNPQTPDCSHVSVKPNSAGTACECETDYQEFATPIPEMCEARTSAACTGDQVFSPASAGGGVCTSAGAFLDGENIAADNDSYTAAKCRDAGWMVGYSVQTDTRENAAEICGIPVARDDNLAAAAALESQPQIADGTSAGGCIIRMSPGFDVANSTPDISNAVRCDSDNLFGGDGEFPQMPEGFSLATDMLMIAVVPDGRNRIFFNGVDISEVVPEPEPTTQTGGGGNIFVASDGIDYTQFGGVVGGIVAVYIGINYLTGTFAADDFSFSPDFGYRITESGYAANAGGRMDLRKDNLHLYSAAKQTNANGEFGDFRYTTGGEYTADFWTAAFSESLQGETANYDFSLSANLQSGIWNISPVYRMHSRFDKDDTETRNTLNLEGILRYNRWQIRPSAGFRWENADNFTENARFRIDAIHRF